MSFNNRNNNERRRDDRYRDRSDRDNYNNRERERDYNGKERVNKFLSSSSSSSASCLEAENEVDVTKLDTTVIEYDDWDSMDLPLDLYRGIMSAGFEKPSEIQRKAIVPIKQRRDILAQACSGQGKTGAFCIGALTRVDTSRNTNQILILSNTRELALQITNVMTQLSNMMVDETTGEPRVRIKTLVGGTSVDDDVRSLREQAPHIIIGTCGRVYDMMRRRYINANDIQLCILDEADELLSSGFEAQIREILYQLGPKMQLALFSATFSSFVFEITSKIMRNPIEILVKREQLSLEGIKTFYIKLDSDENKFETLKDLLLRLYQHQTVVFAKSVNRVEDLYDALKANEFSVCKIHAKLDSTTRQETLNGFRTGLSRILVTTDLTARGVDVQTVSVVINFDMCSNVDNYLHRIGRSGRHGRRGLAINFVAEGDYESCKKIEKHYEKEMLPLPNNVETLI